MPKLSDTEAEQCCKKLYDSLNEKDRRRYAATLYIILEGKQMDDICAMLGTTEKTVRKGLSELKKKSCH